MVVHCLPTGVRGACLQDRGCETGLSYTGTLGRQVPGPGCLNPRGRTWRWGRESASADQRVGKAATDMRSEEHTSELQPLRHLVCRLLLVKILIGSPGVPRRANNTSICPVFMFPVPGWRGWSKSLPSPLRRPSRTEPLLFFNDTATTEIYTLSLHDALPI